jgi:hypothetical protein
MLVCSVKNITVKETQKLISDKEFIKIKKFIIQEVKN